MKDFLTTEEEQALVEEIRRVETGTSGEIRVFLSYSRWVLRCERHAWKVFRRLRMDATSGRNGALIVVYPRRRRFVVLGDSGFHGRVEPGFWEDLAESMTEHLKTGRAFNALREGIRSMGGVMAAHWPASVANPDELDNAVLTDKTESA